MPKIVLVTFDLDNTLWDVDHVIVNAERETRAWFDAHAPEVNRQFGREDFMRMRMEAIAADARLAHDVSALRRETFRRAIEAVGYGERESRQLAQRAFDVFLHARQQVELYEGAVDLLELLGDHYRLAALTNGNADVIRIGLDRYFDFALSAADVGASKPHPAIFREALARSRSAPHEMVHIGDHPVDDVQGAAGVGAHTIWFNRREIEFPGNRRPTRETRKLEDIPEAIRGIEGR